MINNKMINPANLIDVYFIGQIKKLKRLP